MKETDIRLERIFAINNYRLGQTVLNYRKKGMTIREFAEYSGIITSLIGMIARALDSISNIEFKEFELTKGAVFVQGSDLRETGNYSRTASGYDKSGPLYNHSRTSKTSNERLY